MREDLSIEVAARGAARWRAAVREHPRSAAARYALGVALVRAGLEEEAEAAFRESVLLRPDWAEAHNALGATLCRLDRHDEGIEALAAAAGMADTFLDLSSAGGIEPGNLLQLGDEVLHVTSVDEAGHRCEVLRGSAGTTPAAHAAGTLVYRLSKRVFIVPFARDFFGSPASGQFSYPIFIPDVRIAAAELIMTNIRGNSEPSLLAFTSTLDSGLRTLSGGQLSIQVEGYLAIQPDVAPPLLVDGPHSVRDIYAVVREAPAGSPATGTSRGCRSAGPGTPAATEADTPTPDPATPTPELFAVTQNRICGA